MDDTCQVRRTETLAVRVSRWLRDEVASNRRARSVPGVRFGGEDSRAPMAREGCALTAGCPVTLTFSWRWKSIFVRPAQPYECVVPERHHLLSWCTG